MKPTGLYLQQSQAVLEDIFRRKRSAILAAHGNVEIEYKEDRSVVTEMDRNFEVEIKQALKQLDIAVGFEGEEHGIEGSRDTYWLIDPIDGTESFVRGLPFVRNMATLVDGGKPIFAVVYRPIDDEMFVGTKGKGVTKNGDAVHVSQRTLDRSSIELLAHFQHSNVEYVVRELATKVLRFSISDFCYVIDGRTDGHIMLSSGGGPWDYATRGFMIAEAGGRVANVGSRDFDFTNTDILAANPVIFDQIMEILVTAQTAT